MRATSLDKDLRVALNPADAAVPRVLPVDHLSHSSIALLRRCPEKWRRRYIDREYEPPSGSMIVGSATHGACRVNYQQKITSGRDLAVDDVLDAYADEWHQRIAEEESIEWDQQKPASVRESGQQALAAYHQLIAPATHPTSVERKFALSIGEAEWQFLGWLDLEEHDGAISDLKSRRRRLPQAEADNDLQAGVYLLALRAENTPASEFRFHTMLRQARPAAEIVRTRRTDTQLDSVLRRIIAAASEIYWRVEHGVWDGAPAGAWWCAEHRCGYYSRCPFGGAR